MSHAPPISPDVLRRLCSEVLVCESVGNSPTAHVPHPDGDGPLCRDKLPEGTVDSLVTKPTSVYPSGWLDWCSNCHRIVERGDHR